jgi:Zn-dependent M28 family amino/carboxypeptidase
MTTVGYGLSELDEVMARAAARLDRRLAPDPMPEAGAFYRADTYPFVKRGVPAVFCVGGPAPDEPEDSPVNQKMAEYGRTKYHKVTDEYDAATWDLTGVEEDARVYFEAGWNVADDVRFPNWYYGNEFRLLRDAMRSGGRGVAAR